MRVSLPTHAFNGGVSDGGAIVTCGLSTISVAPSSLVMVLFRSSGMRLIIGIPVMLLASCLVIRPASTAHSPLAISTFD